MEPLEVIFEPSLIFQAHDSPSCSLFGSVYAYEKLRILTVLALLFKPKRPDVLSHIESLP